jgi:hypothetical protein
MYAYVHSRPIETISVSENWTSVFENFTNNFNEQLELSTGDPQYPFSNFPHHNHLGIILPRSTESNNKY